MTSYRRLDLKERPESTNASYRPLSILLRVTILLCLTPAYLYAGSILLDPSRIFLLFATPVVLFAIFSGKIGAPKTNDWLVIFYSFWISLAFLVSHGLTIIPYLLVNLIFINGCYFIGRIAIRNSYDLRALSKFLVLLICIMCPLALNESITRHPIVFSAIDALPGIFSHRINSYPPRLGLYRAQVVFSHPIHLGLFCSYTFALYYIANWHSINFFKRTFNAGLVFVVAIFAVSSGPLSSLIVMILLIAYFSATRVAIKRPWRSLSIVVLVLYFPLEYFSNRPLLFVIAEFAALNPATAGWRMHIFNFGFEQVLRAPLLGIGLNEHPRPHWLTSSVDNHWLFIALQCGVPAFFAFSSIFYVFFRYIAKNYRDPNNEWDVSLLAIGITLVGMILSLATVAIWHNMLGITMLLLGSFGYMFDGRPNNKEEQPEYKIFIDRSIISRVSTKPRGRRTIM